MLPPPSNPPQRSLTNSETRAAHLNCSLQPLDLIPSFAVTWNNQLDQFGLCTHVHMCVRTCVRARVRACVRVRVCARERSFYTSAPSQNPQERPVNLQEVSQNLL